MGSLFNPKIPDPEPASAMPDPEDALAKRARRRKGVVDMSSSAASDKLAPVPGTIGREYSRSTLGAN